MTSPAGPPGPETERQRAERFERDALSHHARLHAQALRLTRNATDAEDLVQETYLRAYRGFAQFRPGTNIRAWLARILLNSFLTSFRKSRTQPCLTLFGEIEDMHLSAGLSPANQGCPSAEAQVMAEIPDPEVSRAMRAVPDDFRTVLYLADVEGLRYDEIASLVGIPAGTVSSRLHRGRKHLRAQLASRAPSH